MGNVILFSLRSLSICLWLRIPANPEAHSHENPLWFSWWHVAPFWQGVAKHSLTSSFVKFLLLCKICNVHQKSSNRARFQCKISFSFIYILDKNMSCEYRCIPVDSSDFFTLINWDSPFPIVPRFCLIRTFTAIFLSFVLLKISRRTGLASWWLAYGWSCDEKG